MRARCRHRHGPQRLSQSGQQCPVLSLHLSRRAGCGRHHHHPADGNRRRARHRRAGAPGAERCGGRRLRRHRGSGLRPGIPHPQTLRSAADRQDRAGGGQGRHGLRRGHAAHRRPGGLWPAPAAVRVPQRHLDAAHICRRAHGAGRTQPHRLCGRRGRAGAARRANHRRREARHAHSGRPPGGDRARHQAPRLAHPDRRALHRRQSRSTTSAIASTGRTITGSPSAAG